MVIEIHPTESTAKTRAQTVAADVLTTVRSATRAMEAEAMAMIGLEQAYRQANDAAAELKSAIKAEAVAKVETVRARNGTKQPFRDEEKAVRASVKADQDAERKDEKLQAARAKLTKDEMSGKRRDPAAAEKVKLDADDAIRKAKSALLALEQAKESSDAAKAEVKATQEKLKLASMRVRAARIADAGAKRHTETAENIATEAIEAAREALSTEAGGKRTLDRAIRALKATMIQEARAAEAATSESQTVLETVGDQPGVANIVGQQVRTLRALTSRVTRTAGRLPGVRRLGSQGISEMAITAKTETTRETSEDQPDEIYTGTVRLLIFDPVDHADVTRLREGLEQFEGLRVMSVGGSAGGGTCVTVLAEQPVPLASRLGEIEVVDKVAKRGKDLEVRLRLPEQLPAVDLQQVSAPSSTH